MDLGVGFRINHLDQVDADPLLSVGISRRFVKNASWQAEIEYRNRSRLNSNWEARTYGFNMAMVAEDHLGVIRPFVGAGLSWKPYDGNQWGQSFEETKLGVLIMGGFTIPVEGEASIQFGVKHIHNASTSYPIYAAEAATPPIREGDIIYSSGRNNLYNPTELFVTSLNCRVWFETSGLYSSLLS